MPEVAHDREHHGEACLIGRSNYLGIAHRPSGLDHGSGAGKGNHSQPVREGEEGVGRRD